VDILSQRVTVLNTTVHFSLDNLIFFVGECSITFYWETRFMSAVDTEAANDKFESVNCPAAELRGIKIQNLFPCCHSFAPACGRQGSRNPVYIGSLFSRGQVWIPTFVGMTDEVNL
jgi:hypothetical protein